MSFFSKRNYGHLVKFLDNGRNQLFGRVYGIVQLVLTFAIYFNIKGQDIGLLEIGEYTIILLIVMVVTGYFYSKAGLLQSELSSRMIETPEIMEIKRNTEKILEKLKRKEYKK